MKRFVFPLALLTLGCSVEFKVPETASVDCREARDCPDGRVCVLDFGRCVPEGSACVDSVDGAYRSAGRGRRCLAEAGAEGVCDEGRCLLSRCGDGILDAARAGDPEECDSGAQNSDQLPDACRGDCRLPACGDGVRDSGEECDDGNQVEEDGCRLGCIANVCGDAVRDPATEECDDGNLSEQDGCRPNCFLNICGDRILDLEREECDDGNDDPNDGCDRCAPTVWSAELLVGRGEGGGRGTEIALQAPYAVAADPRGGLYVADTWNNRVLKLAPDGGIVLVAGNGHEGFGGDGGPATAAPLFSPTGLAVDGAGNLYIADTSACVRRVDAATGIIQTVAGIPLVSTHSGDGGLAIFAGLDEIEAIATDGGGTLYVAGGNRVRRVDPFTGIIETYAGTGGCTLTGPTAGPATQVEVCSVNSLAIDPLGRLNLCARVRDATGSTVRDELRRADPLTRQVEHVHTVVDGCVSFGYFEDGAIGSLTYDGRVLRIAPSGERSFIVGTGASGFSGDGGPASAASLRDPSSLAIAPDGAIFIADSFNNRVRRVDPATSVIRTVVGNGSPFTGGCVKNTCRRLGSSMAMAFDPQGRLVMTGGSSNIIVRADLVSDFAEVLAGAEPPGFSGDGGPAINAELFRPNGLVLDPRGNLFFADGSNQRIRRIDAASGVITTVAGGNGELQLPSALARSASGDLFVSDQRHQVLRVDAATGAVTVFAGSGSFGYSGDGGPATQARLREPLGLAFDSAGRLVVADNGNHVLRRIGTDGVIRTIAGTGIAGFSGDGGAPTAAQLNGPLLLAIDGDDNIYVTDHYNHRVRRISADLSTITTVAGNGATSGPRGDGGPATQARVDFPRAIAIDPRGGVLVGEEDTRLVRRIDPGTGTITTVFGPVMPPGDGPLATSRLGTPRALSPMMLAGGRVWLVADGDSGRVRGVDLDGAEVSTLVGYPGGFPDEGAAAWSSRLLESPLGIAADPAAGVFYVSEAASHTLREIDTKTTPWRVTTLAGTHGKFGFDGDHFYAPGGLALDEAHQMLFVADTKNHVVRALNLGSGELTTVAGTPNVLGLGEDGAALEASLNSPEALALAADGSLYVADTGNHRVLLVREPLGASPQLETVTGYGVPGASGEGTPASAFPIDTPRGLAVDSRGNLFVAGGGAVRVVSTGADGLAHGDGEVSFVFGRPPRQQPLEKLTQCLAGLSVTDGPLGADSRLLLLDSCRGYLIALDRQ